VILDVKPTDAAGVGESECFTGARGSARRVLHSQLFQVSVIHQGTFEGFEPRDLRPGVREMDRDGEHSDLANFVQEGRKHESESVGIPGMVLEVIQRSDLPEWMGPRPEVILVEPGPLG